MNFNPANFVSSLPYMGWGMLGILIVMGIIIIVTMILEKITSGKSEEKKDEK